MSCYVDSLYRKRIGRFDPSSAAVPAKVDFSFQLSQYEIKQVPIEHDQEIGFDINPENLAIAKVNPFKSSSRRTWRKEQNLNASDSLGVSSSSIATQPQINISLSEELSLIFRNDHLEKSDLIGVLAVDRGCGSAAFAVDISNSSSTLHKLSINKKVLDAKTGAGFECNRELVPLSLCVPFSYVPEEQQVQLLRFHDSPKNDLIRMRQKIVFQGNTKALVSLSLALNPSLAGSCLLDVSIQVGIALLMSKDDSYDAINVKIRPRGTYNATNKAIHFSADSLLHALDGSSHQFDAIVDVTGSEGVLDGGITSLPVIIKGHYNQLLSPDSVSKFKVIDSLGAQYTNICMSTSCKIDLKYLK